jgi:hypothetical protein
MNLNNRYIREFIIDRQSNYEKWNITAGTYQIGYLDSNGTWIFRDSKKPPSLQPREQIILTIYDIENNTIGDKQRTIAENEAITLNIFTGRTNIFSKTFYPPTAIILIKTESQWNSSSNDYMPVLILDGSLSNNPSRDSYIMSWNWKIDNTTLNNLGEKVRAPDILFDGITHTIYLTVTNNFGMTGTSSITYS